ncbi:MAG: replication-associated recombination protein A, partial [Calditrichia bacterium]|nr:replication-associated recombination protein A [Calditrichia bacterium]
MLKQPDTKKRLLLRPLAERIRPQDFSEMVGQGNLLDEYSPFMVAMDETSIYSMILWGPPGVGKTTAAKILANRLDLSFMSISAVSSGVKQVREILDTAKKMLYHQNRKTILFIDEIHRFSKSQQDALLHAVEEGHVILVGATTENPSFEVISPLLSRCKVHKLEWLSESEIKELILRAITIDKWLLEKDIDLEKIDHSNIYQFCGGDARKALNLLEQCVIYAEKNQNPPFVLNKKLVEKVAAKPLPNYDKAGDAHYDFISAFIKSVRGSDPDAALYWMARMLNAGEKPEFIARRLIILASEDIGNAEPFALMLSNSAYDAVHKIGMPEARIILGQVTTYLASLPKSNAAYLAIDKAMETADKTRNFSVPLHLRNAPTKLM